MSNFGLTSNGFEIKRLQDIKLEIEQYLRDTFGEINVSPDSVFGQVIGVFSKSATDIWEQLESVYFSQYPDTAEGVSLDYAVALTGVNRLPSTYSNAELALKGNEGTNVPASSQVSVLTQGDIFETINDVTISALSIAKIFVDVDTVIDATVYTITIDATPHAINSGVGATKLTIAAALVADINGSSTVVTATDNLNGSLTIKKISTNFDTTVDANMSWYTPSFANAMEKGSISAPQRTLTEIETPISGWNSVTNFVDALEGRDIETDAELRLRRSQSLRIAGAATVEAMRSRIIQDVSNVIDALVFENDTDNYIGLRPPHSIEVIVSHPNDSEARQELAYEIWYTKPGGIQLFGTQTEIIQDSQGTNQTIKFSRPTSVDIYIDVTVTKNSEGQPFPDDGDEQIENNLLDYIDTMRIGEDVIYQKLFTPIYKVDGIASIDLKIGTAPSPTGTSNITITSTELAVTDAGKINVNVIP